MVGLILFPPPWWGRVREGGMRDAKKEIAPSLDRNPA